MQKLSKALLLAGVAGLSLSAGIARADDPPSPFTGKVALYSEYEYRGISQTSEKPALQLNLDYAHPSGFYVGTFMSNVKWLKDTAELLGETTNAQMEIDLYVGFKKELVKDWTFDVGYLRYEYPNSKGFAPATVKPNTDEAYIGVSYGPATLKYSYSFNNTFGVPNSKGSDYIELSIAQPLIENKLTLTGVLGYQRYAGTQELPGGVHFNNDDFSYGVWKIGVVYDFGKGLNVGAYYKGTNADSQFYTYKGKDWSDDRLVAFVSYSF
jgi:uncharacterized protein (TIGR02001 family)